MDVDTQTTLDHRQSHQCLVWDVIDSINVSLVQEFLENFAIVKVL